VIVTFPRCTANSHDLPGRHELKIGKPMHILSSRLRFPMHLNCTQYADRPQFSLGTKLSKIRKDGAEIYANSERRGTGARTSTA